MHVLVLHVDIQYRIFLWRLVGHQPEPVSLLFSTSLSIFASRASIGRWVDSLFFAALCLVNMTYLSNPSEEKWVNVNYAYLHVGFKKVLFMMILVYF